MFDTSNVTRPVHVRGTASPGNQKFPGQPGINSPLLTTITNLIINLSIGLPYQLSDMRTKSKAEEVEWVPVERAKQLRDEATFVRSDPVWIEDSDLCPESLHETLNQSDPDRFARASALLDQGLDVNVRAEYSGPPKPSPPGAGIRKVGFLRRRQQCTALYDAATRGDLESVQFLLSHGADPRVTNLTGLSFQHVGSFQAVETLCGLDAMRTSKDPRIVELAEELFGEESEEDFVRRRDAFDPLLLRSAPRHMKKGYQKAKVSRVRSVLGTRLGKNVTSGVKRQRYELRPRDPGLSYA
jgi:hypothetical protein